jgi:hypothetical protein
LNAKKYAVPVQPSEGHSFEDKHVERSLQKIELFVHGAASPR